MPVGEIDHIERAQRIAVGRRRRDRREFIPQVQQLGMELKDAWLTMYGNQPQIMASAQMEDLVAMQGIIDSKEWQGLINKLLDYVENYQFKIVPARAGFQM